MMKFILSWLLSGIILYTFISGRFRIIVGAAAELDNSNGKTDQNGGMVTDSTSGKDSVLTISENSEINTVFYKETERQDLLLPSQSVIDDPSFLNSIEVSSELSSTAEAVVFPSADTAFELKHKVKNQLDNENNSSNSSNSVFTSFENDEKEYIVHAEPKVQAQMTTTLENSPNKELNESESVLISSHSGGVELKKTAPQHEDIPSFSEWTQKQLAEAEKKKTDQNETTERLTRTRGKFRNKNYASPDCGAKIVAANPESLSSSAVLSPLKDEYMLNYCTNRIWFVVELCEAIQAKQLDLANFELFSSSPKYFSVSVSHRFPTRDWSNVGKFTAQDSRDVQTFNLHPHLFGKYVKVELHSHYGREQFCPISWVGVYGTSEFEVLAKEEDDRHLLSEDEDEDGDDEDMFVGGHRRDSPKNLFSSATDAVLSIVKKATAPFMKTSNNETESWENVENTTDLMRRSSCVCPRYIVVCNNCSQSLYDEVFELLSCRQHSLTGLIFNSFTKRTLINSESCNKFGLDFNGLRTGAPFPSYIVKDPERELNYLTVMLKESVLAALCNVLAVIENKVVVNATVESSPHTLKNVTLLKKNAEEESCEEEANSSIVDSAAPRSSSGSSSAVPPSDAKTGEIHTVEHVLKPSEPFGEKIEPTKTLSEEEVKLLPSSSNAYAEESATNVAEEKSTNVASSSSSNSLVGGSLHSIAVDTGVPGRDRPEAQRTKVSPTEGVGENGADRGNGSSNAIASQDSTTLESIISDLNAMEKAADSPANQAVPSASNFPSESIFLRLANRIKNLEINMSLSSTYLEELSKRYRIQLDLLAKTLNLTIQKMEERSRVEEEKERRREKEMTLMRVQLANLTREVTLLLKEKNSWKPRASSISQHVLFVSVEIFLVWLVFHYWKRPQENESISQRTEQMKRLNRKHKRRKSLEGVRGHETPRRKTRRPSDEALEIALCRTYKGDVALKIDKKRKRKKKDSKCSINMVSMVKRKKSEENGSDVSLEKQAATATTSNSVTEEIPAKRETGSPGAGTESVQVHLSNRFAPISGTASLPQNGEAVPSKVTSDLASPEFLKTALAVRNTRLKSAPDKDFSITAKLDEETTQKETHRKSSSLLKKYMKKLF